ncbi:MAG: hypothetical protein GXO60_07885 [Epsilonproteobacteria bacterium]|nr:hypothetical protein [Campylobacterota bacterium]
MVIGKSLRLVHLEKLIILSKEITFIENILNYYGGYFDNTSSQDASPKKNIKKFFKDINSIKDMIKELEKINEEHKTINIDFIIFYDYIRTQIEEILLVIDSLYTKMNQLFGEMLNQYLPYPTFFGRRYSSNGIMMFLDNYYQYLFSRLTNKDANNVILGWSYNNGFRYKIFRNKNVRREEYSYQTFNDYIELPYWYYELPFLIPAVTHEVIEISIRTKNSKLQESYKEFEKHINSFFEDESNHLIRYIDETLGYGWVRDNLARELFSDYVAFKIHGESYLFTLLHNLLGEHVSKDFLTVIYNKDGTKINRYKFQPNDWIFTKKREHNHLRLYFLTHMFEKEGGDREYLTDIKNILNQIINLSESNKENGFETLYKSNFPNYHNTYEVVKIYLKELYENIIKFPFKIDKSIINEIKNDINIDFNFLWKDRFNMLKKYSKSDEYIVPYKGEFRKLIHKNFNQLTQLNHIEKDIRVLTLRKVRKDGVNKKKLSSIDLKKKLEDIQKDNNKGNKECWIAYGIYDFAILEKKNNEINLKNELDKILEENNQEDEYKKLKYFDSKSILMKIVEIKPTKKIENSSSFILIINIEVKKASISNNLEEVKKNKRVLTGYENLAETIEDISKELNKYKNEFQKAQIFKSLGQKDLTIIIKYATISNLNNIIDSLNSIPSVNRTFSIYTTENTNAQIDKEYMFTSYIRVPKNNSIESFKKKIKDFCKKATFYQTTGVMDYRIDWGDLKDIEILFKNYEKIFEYISDFQTKIEKRLII